MLRQPYYSVSLHKNIVVKFGNTLTETHAVSRAFAASPGINSRHPLTISVRNDTALSRYMFRYREANKIRRQHGECGEV